ncbi:MAG: hypothetical protein HQL31_08280 [Planctomycetes bacterium]|nr:hypothetical protein [Planctomycetota bacterium]
MSGIVGNWVKTDPGYYQNEWGQFIWRYPDGQFCAYHPHPTGRVEPLGRYASLLHALEAASAFIVKLDAAGIELLKPEPLRPRRNHPTPSIKRPYPDFFQDRRADLPPVLTQIDALLESDSQRRAAGRADEAQRRRAAAAATPAYVTTGGYCHEWQKEGKTA